jgi:hypothetical protein
MKKYKYIKTITIKKVMINHKLLMIKIRLGNLELTKEQLN